MITLLFALVFSAVLVLVILLVFKASIIVSAAVGGVLFLAVAIPVLIASRKKKSWEGVVEEKKKLGAMSREYQHHATYKYRIVFRTNDGRRKVWTDDHLYVRVYDYLQEGDRVRYIGEVGTKCAFEKYDKSGDEELMCVSCAALNDPRGAYCAVCGAPLMKGNPVFGDE